jgi:hypothetical protein
LIVALLMDFCSYEWIYACLNFMFALSSLSHLRFGIK